MLIIVFLLLSSKLSLSCDENYIEKMSEMIEEVKGETDGVASKNLPTSVVLAQAILETGNGTSYSAKVRNNHFGLSKKSMLMSFNSAIDSVFKYFYTLNTKPYYKHLRQKLTKGETNLDKIIGAISLVYAEDKKYQGKVIQVIEKCELTKFDWNLKTRATRNGGVFFL